ncbi:hypothetical protein ACFL67_01345 [candidate division KSB1 bacterium]
MKCGISIALAILLICGIFCSDNGSTNPEPEPLTLDGTWAVSAFDEKTYGTLVAPSDVNSRLTIGNDRFSEIGTIRGTAFSDSGTVTELGDSLRFFSQVVHRFYMGKLNEDNLAIRRYMTSSYKGLAIYRKTSN